MGISAAIIAGAAVAGTAITYQNGQDAKASQDRANRTAEANAKKQAELADQANNAANMKRPNTKSILDNATLAGKAGQSGTMLTGPQGVDPSALTLGKNTLLGS